MTNIELMKISINNYVRLRELSISKRQFELIQYLHGKKATSRDIADQYDICVQNASQQLKNLFSKGYLTREEINDKTGGYLFEYTTNAELELI
jgi:predicted transcriptional regulator